LRAPFTHLWSTCTLWFIPETEREQVFAEFKCMATPGARLVIDDCLCYNKIISQRAQACVYDRLNLERLWSKEEYIHKIQDAGFVLDEVADISVHCELSYIWLAKRARQLSNDEINLTKLASDYDGTVAAIRQGDLAWFVFVATLQS
jgi:hypothetical protein